MTKYLLHIPCLLTVLLVLTACSQDEVDYYNNGYNGIYFNYDDEDELSNTVNFADYVLTEPTEIEQTLKLRLLGYIADTDRRFALKTREVEGYPLANITLGEGVLPAGAYELDLTYTVAKPEEMGVTYAAEIYLDPTDGTSDLGEGNEGFDKFTVYVSETYSEPSGWYNVDYYVGEWSIEKYKLLAQISGKTDFYTYSNWSFDYAFEAVKQLRAYNQEHPDEPSTIDLPFRSEYNYETYMNYEYEKPWYWTETQDYYFGEYDSDSFITIANAVGVTTANEYALFAGDETAMKQTSKGVITGMMENFNSYYWWNSAPAYFKYSYSTLPMFADVDYDVVQPACWTEGYETYDLVAKYYGDYSDEKYKFMLKTWLAYTTNTDDFAFVQLFPVYYGYNWEVDSNGAFYDSEMGGEDAIKECYRVIKAEYDKDPGSHNFTFPVVE